MDRQVILWYSQEQILRDSFESTILVHPESNLFNYTTTIEYVNINMSDIFGGGDHIQFEYADMNDLIEGYYIPENYIQFEPSYFFDTNNIDDQGNHNIIYGESIQVNGYDNILLGKNLNITGNSNIILATNLTLKKDNQVIIGKYNLSKLVILLKILTKFVFDLKEQVNILWYGPGGPIYQLAKISFDKIASKYNR
jgi:hypothetical protein